MSEDRKKVLLVRKITARFFFLVYIIMVTRENRLVRMEKRTARYKEV